MLKSDAGLAHYLVGRRVLLVLDNAEDAIRVDRAGVHAMVEALMEGAAGVRLLLATRVRLGDLRAAEEGVQEVRKLPPRPAREAFLAVAGPRLSVEAQRSEDFEELLEWLDGHPLTLVLVAGLVGVFPLGELRSRLAANELELLVDQAYVDDDLSGAEDGKLRTKRLLSSLNLSYGPLEERHAAAAEMFAWLSCFPEGLPAVLVPHVFGAGAERQVGVLQRVNLVEEQGAERRLTLPTPVRAYAARQVAKIEEGRRLELVTASFGALAGWLGGLREKIGKPGARDAMVRAAAEEGSLVALAHELGKVPVAMVGITGGVALANRIADAFASFAYILQHADRAQSAISIGERLRPIVEMHPASQALAVVDEHLGDLYLRTARLKEAEGAYQRSLAIYGAIEDRLGEANTERALGDLYLRTDRLKEAESAYQRALPIYQAIGDRLGATNTERALGDLYLRTARLKEAESAYQRVLPIYREIESRLGEANTERALGDLYLRTARLKEAEGAYQRSLAIYGAIEDRLGETNTERALGDLYLRTARLKEAEGAYQRSLSACQVIEDRRGEANTLAGLGHVSMNKGEPRAAFMRYVDAHAIHRDIGDSLGVAGDHVYLGRAALAGGSPLQAIWFLRQALVWFESMNDRYDLIIALVSSHPALAALQHEAAANAALVLAWHYAGLIEHPLAAQLAEATGASAPSEADAIQARSLLTVALSDCEAQFHALGEDPYSPLPPPDPTP